jgi:predicted nucleic acid-binding Zn ribbon protein
VELDEQQRRERNTNIFDFIVLLGMAANIIVAVFMLLYYFDLF